MRGKTMNTVDDLSKQILADVATDFRARNLGTSALRKGYVGPAIAELELKYCAEGRYSKVDFDLALKQLEESKFIDTGPMAPFENKPDSIFMVMGVFSKRKFVYLTEKGYKAAQRFTAKPRPPAPSVQERGSGDADRKFARLAIDEARKSVPEPDGRSHPKVGAVVVKNGKLLSTAYRGERPENHAEYIALEKKLTDEAVAGATVYTTLEPCTTRNHPKIPCADRLIERKVARVVIRMLDPDDRISGKGQRKLRRAGIVTDLFPHDLAMEVEELNRDFTRYCEQQEQARQKSPGQAAPTSTLTAQGAKVTNSPVASGTNISQTINSPTVNLSLPVPTGGMDRERYEEWRELDDEINGSIEQMGYALDRKSVV